MRFVLCKPNCVSISSPSECVILNLIFKKERNIYLFSYRCVLAFSHCQLLFTRQRLQNSNLSEKHKINNHLGVPWHLPQHGCVYIPLHKLQHALSLCASTPPVLPSPNTCSDRVTLSSSFHKCMRSWGVTHKPKSWLVRSLAVIKQDSSRGWWAGSQSICLVTQTSANQQDPGSHRHN